MQITREDLNPCTVKLTVVCDPEEVKSGFDKATKQLAKKVRLPGFRPGTAPKHLVEQYLDKGELYDQAIQQVVGNGYKEAIKQQALEPDPTVRPQIEVTKLNETEGEFIIKVGLPAVVELGDLNGIPVEKPAVKITDEDIEHQILELRQRRGTRETITERGVTDGDVCVVNIKADGEEGEARTFMVIAGQTFPSLDQVLANMRVEEVKHVDLTFPENFQEKDWAGKSFKAFVALNSLSALRMPEVDDAFAQSLKTESVDDLKDRIRRGMERAVSSEVEKIVAEQLLDGLLERSKVEVSDNMWEPIAEQRETEIAAEQRKAGKTLDDYAQQQGMTLEETRQNWRDRARTEVKRALLVREIYNQQDMKLTNEDLNLELEEMSREAGVEPKELVKLLEQQNAMNELQFRAISHKVREFLAAQADVKEMAGSARA
ncbi:MAG: trigger factor [Fimbriimonadaceae bacterium]|jgi:trigger factor|nr:trigger factor [Fimbriimonadaceae bacterium]